MSEPKPLLTLETIQSSPPQTFEQLHADLCYAKDNAPTTRVRANGTKSTLIRGGPFLDYYQQGWRHALEYALALMRSFRHAEGLEPK